MWRNRTICEVLEEIRACFKTRNFSGVLGLVEEAQSMANRMEGALGDKRDVRELQNRRRKLKVKVKELEAKADKLEESLSEREA